MQLISTQRRCVALSFVQVFTVGSLVRIMNEVLSVFFYIFYPIWKIFGSECIQTINCIITNFHTISAEKALF